MEVTQLVELLLGQGGVVVALAVAVFILYRELQKTRSELDICRDARLQDAKDTEILARALLRTQEKDGNSGS